MEQPSLLDILKEPDEQTRAQGIAELLFQTESYSLVLTRLLQCLGGKVSDEEARRDLVAILTVSHEFSSWLRDHYEALHAFAQRQELEKKPALAETEGAATVH